MDRDETILIVLVPPDAALPAQLLRAPADGEYVAGLLGAEMLGQVLAGDWQAIFDEDALGKDLPPNRVASVVAQGAGWDPPGSPPPFAALRGPVVFTGVINDGDEAVDVPDRLMEFFRDLGHPVLPVESAPRSDETPPAEHWERS